MFLIIIVQILLSEVGFSLFFIEQYLQKEVESS